MGIPGTSSVSQTLHAEQFAGIPCIYVIQEKTDEAGKNFPYDVKRRLLSTGYTGKVLRIPLRTLTGAKDPNDLWKQIYQQQEQPSLSASIKTFYAAFQHVLSQAQPMEIDTGQQQEFGQNFHDIHRQVSEAIQNENNKAVYDLIDQIVRLRSREELLIDDLIRQAPTVPTAGYNKLKREAKERYLQEQKRQVASEFGLYGKDEAGMFYWSEKGEKIYTSNFAVEIVRDVFVDDGAIRHDDAEQERFFELEAHGRRFTVPASKFESCDWINKFVSSKCYVMAGRTTKQHFINAIKECSNPQRHTLFSHTGWANVNGEMIYLHAGGSIGVPGVPAKSEFERYTNGTQGNESASRAGLDRSEKQNGVLGVPGVPFPIPSSYSVKLSGNLARFDLSPVDGINLQEAIRSSLSILDITSDAVTVPLYCANWRAVLGRINCSLHVWGKSGRGKTALCALIEQHHGKTMDADHLPIAWKSTENAIEHFISQAKDTVVVIDEFKPVGGRNRMDEWHAKADSIFQAIGNGAFRARLNSNLDQRAERRPGALVISTGEDTPRGQSLKARGILVSMNESITTVGTEAQQKLSVAQRDAAQGVYVQVTRAYLEWLAPRIHEIQANLSSTVTQLREQLSIAGHPRVGTNTANVLIGMQYFLEFAVERAAITQEEADVYLSRCRQALIELAEEAAEENTYDSPSEQWLRLIRSAIASEQAHLVTLNGDYPGAGYGWKKTIHPSMSENTEDRVIYNGGGMKIGWIDGDNIYLNPTAAYDTANAVGRNGNTLAIQETTLRKHLDQDGLLASTDKRTKGDKEIKLYVVRKTVEGGRQAVLHLKKSTLFPDGDEEKIYSDREGSAPMDGTPVHHSTTEMAHQALPMTGVPGAYAGTPNGSTGTPVHHVPSSIARQVVSADDVPGEISGTPPPKKETDGEKVVRLQAEIGDLHTGRIQPLLARKRSDETLLWRADATGFTQDLVTPVEYRGRILEICVSDDPMRMQACIDTMKSTLGINDYDRRSTCEIH